MSRFIPQVLSKTDWMTVTATAADTAEIDIMGVIGGDFWEDDEESSTNTKEKMKAELKALSKIGAKTIIINIDSPGGSLAHALSIHDMIALNSATIITRVTGMTASAATIIAQAGNIREMSENSFYLIHRASYGIMGHFNKNELEDLFGDLDVFDNKLIDIYSKRSGKSRADIEELLDEQNGNGKWITAEEAISYGLIDKVTEAQVSKAAALSSDIISKLELPDLPKNETITKTDTIMNEKIDRLLSSVKTLTDFVASKFTGAEDKVDIPEDVQAKLDEFSSEIDIMKTDYETLNSKMEEKDTVISDLNDSVTAKDLEISNLTSEVDQLKAAATNIKGLEGKEDSEKSTDEDPNVLADIANLKKQFNTIHE